MADQRIAFSESGRRMLLKSKAQVVLVVYSAAICMPNTADFHLTASVGLYSVSYSISY